MRSVAIRVTVLFGCILGWWCVAASADSWRPWRDRRVVDPSGRHYVVLNRDPDTREVAFAFVRAAEGSPPVEPIRIDPDAERKARMEGRAFRPPEVKVRQGDHVLARGRLAHAPIRVLVSGRSDGFVALERHGGLGYGDCVVLVPRNGEPIRKLRLTDLFDDRTIASFSRSVSSIHWYRGAWLDEDRGTVVVVGEGPLIRVVARESGTVREGGPEEVLRRLAQPRGAELALTLAVEMRLRAPPQRLLAFLGDEGLSLRTRLRAALLLARTGDPRGAAFFVRTARATGEAAKTQDHFDRAFALEHLREVMGEEAIPILLELLAQDGDEGHAAPGGIAKFGERVIPDLERMLLQGLPHVRCRAVYALGEIGTRRNIPLLLRAIRDPVDDVANAAVNAVVEAAGSDVAEELAALLAEGTTQDGRIAGYFEKTPCEAAVPALVAALGRHPEKSYESRRILKTLRARTGQAHGRDLRAWTAWLESRRPK